MRIAVCLLAALAVLVLPQRLRSQEVYLLGGISRDVEGDSRHSRCWGLSYAEKWGKSFLGSLTWLNEGHLGDHHRDGLAVQFWYRHYLLGDSLSLDAGAGPYFFYDTAKTADRTNNSHGLAGIVSFAATWHFGNSWLLQLRTSLIKTDRDMDTLSALVGFGYRAEVLPSTTATESGETLAGNNEICLLAGQSLDNSYAHGGRNAFSLEYRRRISRLFDWDIGWLNETDKSFTGRYGLYTQLLVGRSLFDPRFSVHFGLGPYLACDNRPGEKKTTLASVLTLTGSFQLSPSWAALVSWHRVSTSYNGDADVLLGGLSYRF